MTNNYVTFSLTSGPDLCQQIFLFKIRQTLITYDNSPDQLSVEWKPVNLYSNFRNFCESFIFANSVKRHICDDKNLQLGQDLPTSENGQAISPNPCKKSEFTDYFWLYRHR